MEFMDGTWKKEINTWEELVGNNLLNQEAVIEGAVHSIRNMGDVAFIILTEESFVFVILIFYQHRQSHFQWQSTNGN